MLNRDLTAREKVLLGVFVVILLVLGYYNFVLTPINAQIENYQNMATEESDRINIAQTTVMRIRQMEKEIESAKKSGTVRPIPEYDSSVSLGIELQSLMAGTIDYLLDFETPDTSDTIVKRPLTVTFRTYTYGQAASVIRAIHGASHLNQISDVSMTASTVRNRNDYNTIVKTTLYVTFFEIKKQEAVCTRHLRKLSDKKGMTLSETLIAVAVLVLISAAILLVLNAGVNTYAKSVTFSESQVLCSTLSSIIADELRYAGTVVTDSKKNVTSFFSYNYGNSQTAFKTDEDGQLTLGDEKLLSDAAYVKGTRATVSVKYTDGIFRVALKILNGKGETIASNDFEVIPLNAEA